MILFGLSHKQYYMSTPPADLSKIMYTPVQDINVSDVLVDVERCRISCFV